MNSQFALKETDSSTYYEEEVRDLDEEEVWVLVECKRRLAEIESFKHKDVRQRSRDRWAELGDDNTSYFHRIINKRKVCNNIPGLLVDGVWVSRPTEIKKHTLKFFKERVRGEDKGSAEIGLF
ncbi:RNA-directed DNA polymerase, eukaryota, Nucleotide-binding alpha-beta plait domain protein [Artemisia annua]|uniref:RNA-directed DNA polymerase, eukaryota, Nucleotide-binding alpha-beta plait domain protein n=1 Tax=Artemisia annua TaxID=35608 RepID=A0A2U1NMW6_ARTAN|nr:RNA-directed DNA polymerase, eukaryota, Nucleotide-binding alpha-beta plait domain protein [Artemisia annua]